MHVPGLLRDVRPVRLIVAAIVSLLVNTVGYLALVVPDRWFASDAPLTYGVDRIAVVRGAAEPGEGPELRVRAREGDRTVLVSVETDFPSDRYPAIAWSAANVPEGATVRMLWRTDVAPQRLNELRLGVDAGHPRVAVLARQPEWVGRIKGVALYVEPVAAEPLRISRLVAKPMTARDVVADRFGEWLAFEPWTGTSISGLVGGADVQELPLPLFAASVVVLGWILWWIWCGRPARRIGVAAAILVFASAWVVLDLRWSWNLARQVAQTAARFQGLDIREKHRADGDGPLFEFVDRARAEMPAAPVRVFVAAEAAYFRARAAWHLYPHNAMYDPVRDALPAAGSVRPGDWVLVWRRRGIQYDAAQRLLRWDNGEPTHAALRARGDGAALFEIVP